MLFKSRWLYKAMELRKSPIKVKFKRKANDHYHFVIRVEYYGSFVMERFVDYDDAKFLVKWCGGWYVCSLENTLVYRLKDKFTTFITIA